MNVALITSHAHTCDGLSLEVLCAGIWEALQLHAAANPSSGSPALRQEGSCPDSNHPAYLREQNLTDTIPLLFCNRAFTRQGLSRLLEPVVLL